MTRETLALLCVALAVLALAAWSLVDAWRRGIHPAQWPFERLMVLMARCQWGVRVLRPFKYPADRGAVIVCNHRSSIDPMLLHPGIRRMVYWMVASEYVSSAAMGWYLKLAGVIPTKRGGVDTASTREAIRLASAGKLVGMLPEGRINMTEELLLPVRPGAIMIARKAGVPIIPCYVEGSPYRRTPVSPFFMLAKVRVWYGDAIDVGTAGDEHEGDEAYRGEKMIEVMRAVATLAGQPDYPITLAGRRWKPTDEEVAHDAAESEARRKNGG